MKRSYPSMDDAPVLRPIATSDADSVLELGRTAFDWATEHVLWNKGLVQWYCEKTQAVSFVAKTDERLVGFVLAFMEGQNGYLGWIAVAPDARRRGIGRSLLWAACEALKRQGAQDVSSDVRSGAETEFFEEVGFEDTGLRKAILTRRLAT